VYCFSNKEILDILNKKKNSISYSIGDINDFISNCTSSLYPYGNKMLVLKNVLNIYSNY